MKKLLRSEYFPLFLLITVNLVIGYFTLHHYGESWDEQNYYFYAEQSRRAYVGLFTPGFSAEYDPTIRYYGPIYILVTVVLHRILPNLIISDIGHAVNWVTFQFGIFVFYNLARRWLKPASAFGATLLFATQPLFWGHAFINPKDMPFMIFFMTSLWLGLRAVDAVAHFPGLPNRKQVDLAPLIRKDLHILSSSKKILLTLLAIGALLISVVLALKLVSYGQSILPPIPADDAATEIETYLRPLLGNLWRIILPFVLSLISLGAIYLPHLPNLKRNLIDNELALTLRAIANYARVPALFLAAITLGITGSLRLFGFAAFVFIAIFFVLRYQRSALNILLAYLSIALLIMFIAYPFLWTEPLTRLLITFRVMLNFPWPGQTLFNGILYSPDQLPRAYLPTIFGIQLSEPLIALIFIGLIFLLRKRKNHFEFFILFCLWFLFPFLFALLLRPSLYDNARQFFFILPPLFLLSGLALESIFEKLKPVAMTLLMIILLAPGIYGIWDLHPYEYIYYNRFIGGVDGAFRRFEMDYWVTSSRAAMTYVDANAPAESWVLTSGAESSALRYARPDLKVDAVEDVNPLELQDAFYVLLSSRGDNDRLLYPNAPILYEIKIRDVILMVVKKVIP